MTTPRFHALPAMGVLRLAGPDALDFLQAQLTADLRPLQAGEAALAAWCSPAGRVLALLRVTRVADGLLAVLPRELCASVAGRLARYVLRARVSVSDASGSLAVVGFADDERARPGPEGALTAIRMAGARQLLIGPTERLDELSRAAQPAAADAWELDCIRRGEPEVYAATAENWLPQMLNLDLLDAVSFRKGCYPGQEIVARTRNLGRIKRRMLRYALAGPSLPAPGSPLQQGAARVGEVVRSARHAGRAELLAVVNLDAAGAVLQDGTGTVICSPEPLPYPLPEAGAAA